jgi:hypothetical protein
MAEPKITVITVKIREQVIGHALFLQAQRHHSVSPRKTVIQIAADLHRSSLPDRICSLPWGWSIQKSRKGIGHKTGRPAQHNIRAACA